MAAWQRPATNGDRPTTYLNSPQGEGRMTSVTDRDFLADMSAAIEAAMPAGDYVAPVVAADLVDRLRVEDPDLLAGWLDLRASIFLADVIARRSNGLRQAARVNAPRKAFASAARSFAGNGGTAPLRPFAFEYVIDEANTRRPVAFMTAADCRFVADRYDDSARTAKLEAAFQRAVAKRIGVRTVGDVFTEDEYLVMYQSVTRQGPKAVPSAAA